MSHYERDCRICSACGPTAAVGGVLYYFFLSQPYFRGFFMPFAPAVLVAALTGTWRLVRPRQGGDRRSHDRRAHERRAQG